MNGGTKAHLFVEELRSGIPAQRESPGVRDSLVRTLAAVELGHPQGVVPHVTRAIPCLKHLLVLLVNISLHHFSRTIAQQSTAVSMSCNTLCVQPRTKHTATNNKG